MNKRGLFVKLLAKLPLWVWGLLIVLYIVAPIDLIPDLFGFPGRLDDLLIALAGAYYLRMLSKRRLREERSAHAGADDSSRPGQQSHRASEKGSTKKSSQEPEDPYKVLDVKRGQPLPEIQRRYKEQLLQYHPDRVQHLGPELQELAEQKTIELNQAFQRISEEHRQKT